MPTGTGKTETMLALLVAACPEHLMVVVPSDALREQVAAKFEELGVLKKFGIVVGSALLPVVGRVSHGFKTAEAADVFAQVRNLIVATPQAIGACAPAARHALVSACSHLFIDEAHHVAADTWSAIREEFAGKRVVQFTATPFREDGRHLQGRIVYSFPLREAQRQGYFSKIDYSAVFDFMFTELVPETGSASGPFRFKVKTGAWSVPYEARVEDGRLRYYCRDGEEVYLRRPRSEYPLSDWLNVNGLLLILDGDRIIVNDLLYKPTWETEPFNRVDLVALDWTGTDIRLESQKEERRENSIQFRVIADLLKETVPWDVILDDDGAGEIADVVAIRVRHDELLIRFVHCKYSRGNAPGARVEDLYQVCGQAQKSIAWRRSDLAPFFRTLGDRARRKNQREGLSPFAAGDYRKLLAIQDRSRVLRLRVEMIIVQPGLSAARATTSQLDVLASTKSYLKTTIQAPLAVWRSP